MLHLPQLELPVAGQLGLGQFLNPEAVEQRQQHERLAGRLQFIAVAEQVFLGDEALDDRGARGRCAEAALAHGFAQFLVVHQFARAFHRAEQRGFRVTRRRLGHRVAQVDVAGLDLFVRLHGHEVRAALLAFRDDGRFLAVHFEPAGLEQNLALGLERLALDARDARGHEMLGRRIKHREKTPRDEVVNLVLDLVQALRRHVGRDDRKVIADLRVVEDALVRPHPALVENRVGERVVGRAVHRLEHAAHGGNVILGQRARIGTRIGEHLVAFVERLRDLERARGGEAEAFVRVALEAGEIEQQRRELRGRLALLSHDARLALALGANGRGAGLIPQALGTQAVVDVFLGRRGLGEFLIEPAAGIISRRTVEGGVQFPISTRDKLANAILALDEDRQRRRLHAPDGRLVEAAALRVEGRHGTRAIDADEPVGLAAAGGGVGERAQILVGAQMLEAVANRGGRHGLQPQALERLLGAGVLDDVAEDQLALAPGVTGIDEAVHVLSFEQLLERLEPRQALLARQQVEVRRDDRQIGQTPLALLGLEGLGTGDFQQMPDRRGDHVLVAFVMVVLFFAAPERLGDVGRNGRFLRDDECFSHDDL